jgi:hypothetical protein
MIPKQLWFLAMVFVWQVLPQSLLANTDALPFASIELEREVYFLTPDDEDAVIPPGFYTVEPAPKGLQLIEGITPHEAGETFLIRANMRPYEEKVESPQTRSMPLDEDAHYLALLLPDGQILETIGSYSGVRTRGGKSVADYFRELAAITKEANNENDLLARRDALYRAREQFLEQRKQLAREKEQAAKKPPEWKDYCSKRHPSHVNNHNNCCVQKYDTCLRTAKSFKDSSRRGFEQTCQALNNGCWIKRKTDNLTWMRSYCDSSENRRKIRANNKNKCCSKMHNRCYKSSLSVPTPSGRQESRDRCKGAKEICQGSP